MLRTPLVLMFSSFVVFGAAACGDDGKTGPNCAAGTIEQNGQCVPVQDTVVDTTPVDTVQPDTTPVDTAQREVEVTPEVNNECTPETAGKGFVGAPCTKDCECQTVHGVPLFCYKGFYMQGFSFCTDYADNRTPGTDIQEDEGVDTLSFSSDCFPDVPASERRPLYAKLCDNLDQCKAVGAAYTHCGTGEAGFPWAPGGRGTYCPTATGSNRTLSINSTCIISNVPPFDGSYVQ